MVTPRDEVLGPEWNLWLQDVITSYSIHYTKLYEENPEYPDSFLYDRNFTTGTRDAKPE